MDDETGISGRQLNKICKIYIQNSPQLLKFYQVKEDSSSSEDEDDAESEAETQ